VSPDAAIALGAVALAVGALGGLVRRPLLVTAACLGLALAYALALHSLGPTARPVSAVLAGGGLLVAGELGFGLVDRPPAGRVGRGTLAWLAACGLGGVVVAVVVLTVGSLASGRSAALTALGTAAAVAAVWLLTSAVRDVADED